MNDAPRRRSLIGASILPAVLGLSGCGPFGQSREGMQRPATEDAPRSPAPTASPEQCLSAEDAAARERAAVPAREDMGPENEASPGQLLSRHGLAVFAEGTRIAANQSSDALLLGESDTYGTTVWDTADGTIVDRFDNGLIGAIATDRQDRLAIGGAVTVEQRDGSGEITGAISSGEEPIGPIVGHVVSGLGFTSDGARLVVLGADRRLTVWAASGENCARERELSIGTETVVAFSISPVDGTLAACGSDGSVTLWDAATGEQVGSVESVPGTAAGLAYAPDGVLIIVTAGQPAVYAVTQDGSVTRGPEITGHGPYHVATGASGRVAVVSDAGNRVYVWERTSGDSTLLPTVRGSVGALAWSPDSSTLYAASPSNGVIAWSGDAWTPLELP